VCVEEDEIAIVNLRYISMLALDFKMFKESNARLNLMELNVCIICAREHCECLNTTKGL
jgi:hypothetical protein